MIDRFDVDAVDGSRDWFVVHSTVFQVWSVRLTYLNCGSSQVATKQLLHRLLDALPAEAPWAESDLCQECGTKFTLTMRKHHWYLLLCYFIQCY